MLSPDFPGFVVDPILQKLVHPELYPGYVDPRNCLVFWARPPEHLRELIMMVQQKIRSVKPGLWSCCLSEALLIDLRYVVYAP